MELNIIEKTLRPSFFHSQHSKTKKYIGLGPASYYQFLPYLDDDYLSEWELFKLKTLNKYYYALSIGVPSLAFLGFYYLSPKIFGYIDGYRPQYKMVRIVLGMSLYSIVYTEMNMYPFPNKHFHELITQPEPRGRFIRKTLKDVHPRKWSLISKELNEMGYNFREMNEYSGKESMPENVNKFDDSIY
jgi:hypothetical protein